MRESNPPLRLEGPPSCADRRTGRCRGHFVSRCLIHIFQRYRPRNRFELKMRRAGVEPALPTGGWVTATWARQCPADAICLMSSGTSGVEPTGHEGLSFAALPFAYRAASRVLQASSMRFEPTISTVTGWRGRPGSPTRTGVAGLCLRQANEAPAG